MKGGHGKLIVFVVALFVCMMSSIAAFGRDAGYYAESSKLSTGKWVKIHVERTGMQFVSRQTLLSLGFSDPSKVNVYGYGGAPISEVLSANHPDDLPQLPVVRTSTGLLFYGCDNTAWEWIVSGSQMKFSHRSNAYSDDSWYFLSDAEVPAYEMKQAPQGSPGASRVESFTQRILHEHDLAAPSNTGRVLLGEDFRSPSVRTFNFELPDNVGERLAFNVGFGSKTSGGRGSLMFTANGKSVTSQSADVIQPLTSTEQFMRHTTTSHIVESGGNAFELQIKYQASGTILLARLDYIEVEYERGLKLKDGQLSFNHTGFADETMVISGCDATTVIWDVTDASAPMEVKATLSGSQATFVAPGGYREYVAFNASTPGYAVSRTERVSNQNLHALPVPTMVIITPAEFVEASQRLAKHHEDYDGMTVHVVTPEQVYNEFSSGTADVSAFRKMLKMWYDRSAASAEGEKIKYCLIMSRPTYDYKTESKKAGWPLVPIWLSPSGIAQTTSYGTDDFIGMLDDSLPTFTIGSAKIQVAVGRMPVTTAQEADKMVTKIINYVTKPELGPWRNNVMIIADDQDNGVHLQQAERVYSLMTSSRNGNDYQYERVYLDSYPMVAAATGNTYPEAKERMLKLWNEGTMYINYIGHASPKEWGHEDFLNWVDINNFSNTRLPFLYAATCEFARFDGDEVSGAEVLWLYPTSGIIATICPSRTVYITQNGTLNSATHGGIFDLSAGRSKTVGEIMIDGKNGVTNNDDNKLRYALIGDPAMRLPFAERSVVIDSIAGVAAMLSGGQLPVIPARGRVEIKGHVAGVDGTIDNTFNGVVTINVSDAEMPVETYGNGDNGVVSVYNDRKTKLYKGSTRVVNGRWELTMLMPSEIENNYSPAKMTMYASGDDGSEANGGFDRFYVYGYDENAPEDKVGPEIKLFALNREDFTDGDLVHTSPVVLASFSDESGINLSDAGIGHKITLQLDKNTYFDDLNAYYTPNPDDKTVGSVTYPLSELPAGEHTLQLTVWDNANNSTSQVITFTVGVAKEPVIYTLTTDVNPARESVNFLLATDRPMAKVECLVEVFDLNGRVVWRSNDNMSTDVTAGLTIPWNLCDDSGSRVARGIYLYRATVTTPEGRSVTESRKLAVTAP